MSARVIQLRPAKVEVKSCVDCVHVYMGMCGIYCGYFHDEPWTDKVAESCEAYEPQGR